MLIEIPTDSSLAAHELESSLRGFAPVVRPASGDQCAVTLDVAGPWIKDVLRAVAEWGAFWSGGEVELVVGRRRYRLCTSKFGLDWLDVSLPGAAAFLDGVECDV